MSKPSEHRTAFDTGSTRNHNHNHDNKSPHNTDGRSPSRATNNSTGSGGSGGSGSGGSSSSAQSAKTVDVQMGSEEEKLLMLWYLRVRDAASERPILHDRHAAELMDKVSFDVARSTFRLDPAYVHYVCGRSRLIDEWAQAFLDQHAFEDVLVLQLACGLDSRCRRLSRTRSKDLKWIDVDGPKVTRLRSRLVEPPGPDDLDYTLLTAMVDGDDDAWLRRIPADRPALVIMEGLTYYLEPERGVRLFKRLLGHFSHGSLAFDTIGSIGVAFTSLIEPVRKTDNRLRWGIDDANDFMKLDKRLVLRNRIFVHEFLETGPFGKGYPPMFGGWTPLISMLPNFKKNGQFLRFDF